MSAFDIARCERSGMGMLFPNFCFLRRKESITAPYEPCVIDGHSAGEVLEAYRDGQQRFQQWTSP
jgi:hypothetical protein